MIDLHETFKKYTDDYLKFDRIEDPLHPRPDICAFIWLDMVAPGTQRRMVACAEHDEIWLDVNCELLASVASDDAILMLTRCGIRYDNEFDALAMFV